MYVSDLIRPGLKRDLWGSSWFGHLSLLKIISVRWQKWVYSHAEPSLRRSECLRAVCASTAEAGSVPCWPSYVIHVQAGKKKVRPLPPIPHAASTGIVFYMLKVSGIPAQLPLALCFTRSGSPSLCPIYRWPPALTPSPNQVTLMKPACGHLAAAQTARTQKTPMIRRSWYMFL